MQTLLMDYGSNTHKLGLNTQPLENVKKFYGLDDESLHFQHYCKQKNAYYEVVENASDNLNTIYDTIGLDASTNGFLLSQPIDYEAQKERFILSSMELFFEDMGFQYGNIQLQPIAMYLAAKKPTESSLLIVDSGEESTYIIPICENFILVDAIERSQLGGEIVTKGLQQHLLTLLPNLHNSIDFLSLQLIKEQHLGLCVDFHKYDNSVLNKYNFFNTDIELPDKTTITLGREVYDLCEPLFSPSRFGLDGLGISQKVCASINVM